VNALALCLLALQGGQLEVIAATDRSRVGVGEEVTYTLTATGRSTAAFRAELPTLSGLALLERRERTDVAYGARVPSRTYTLELRLRAEQIGTWTIGPIEVSQGTAAGTAAAVSVTVVSGGSTGGGIGPGVHALVQRVPSPGGDGPSILTVASTRSLFVGDQVDVLTAAWLPRALRLRLRQAPTLSPPVLAGVWAAPTAPISGAVASRVVDGATYDLFVGFQTVYPLTPGMLTIPAARRFWTEPGTRSREERRVHVASSPVVLSVRPLPAVGRPPAFDGPVARDMRIEYRLARSAARAGAVLPVELVVSGDGNMALWPEPQVAWPAGARAYQERVEERLRPSSVRRSGTKAFRFAVVPDSAGTLALPAVEYPYFDPETESYRVARAAPLAIPVVEGDVVGERRTAPLLAAPAGPTVVERAWRLPLAARLALVGFLDFAVVNESDGYHDRYQIAGDEPQDSFVERRDEVRPEELELRHELDRHLAGRGRDIRRNAKEAHAELPDQKQAGHRRDREHYGLDPVPPGRHRFGIDDRAGVDLMGNGGHQHVSRSSRSCAA
jgi:hypothetical protein